MFLRLAGLQFKLRATLFIIGLAMDIPDAHGALAKELEKVVLIRRRFQAEMSWLQWPIPPHASDPDEDKEEESHPICTKALELNCDAVRVLLSFCDGEFVNIDWLTVEACPRIFSFRLISSRTEFYRFKCCKPLIQSNLLQLHP